MQKYLAFLYTNNEQSEKLTIPFIIAMTTTSTKYLGINLPKEARDWYAENYKILIRDIKDTQTNGKIYHVLGLEESIL